MRIAIIGAGISGLVVAYLLCADHEITVFEAADYVGGHTHTRWVADENGPQAVDTGFIVYNERAYPNFVRLLHRLGVETQPSNMSFSLQSERTGLEYAGNDLNALFAQRRNLLSPSFYRMIRDMARFNREARAVLNDDSYSSMRLGDYLTANEYSAKFIDEHLIPIGAAIWSADPNKFRAFPIQAFVRFFENHGMLQMTGRPIWRVITGGSHKYVEKLVAPFADRIRMQSPIDRIRRLPEGVEVTPRGAASERFDHVVLALHSDQALKILADPTKEESEILGSIPYQPNDVVLHADERLLPKRRRAWASWNYHIPRTDVASATITYNMNMLQSLAARRTFCVTLNRTAQIDPALFLGRFDYHHPIYTPAGLAAQRRRAEISGVNRTHYCGAYWGFGFHEDGVNSALAVCKAFGRVLT